MQQDTELASIKEKIKDGIFNLRANDTKNATGAHWSTIRVVFDDEGNRVPNIFACSMANCYEVIKSNLSKDGTGKLKRHYLRCNLSERIGIDSFFDKEYRAPPAKKFKLHHKAAVSEAAAAYLVNDMRPMDSLGKPGMIQWITFLSTIFAHYGSMTATDVERLLPSRITVS